MNAQDLIVRGYRRVSWRHRTISRIDRADWKERLAARLGRSVAELYIVGSRGGVAEFGNQVAGGLCDYYRRCFSKDMIEDVPDDILKAIPTSNHDPVGYIELQNVPVVTG